MPEAEHASDLGHVVALLAAGVIAVCIDNIKAANKIVELCKHELPHAKLLVRAFDAQRRAARVPKDPIVSVAQQNARDRALKVLGHHIEIPKRDVERWLKKLGASRGT